MSALRSYWRRSTREGRERGHCAAVQHMPTAAGAIGRSWDDTHPTPAPTRYSPLPRSGSPYGLDPRRIKGGWTVAKMALSELGVGPAVVGGRLWGLAHPRGRQKLPHSVLPAQPASCCPTLRDWCT